MCSTRKLDLDSVDEREKVIRVSFDESNFNSIEIISRKQSMLALNAGWISRLGMPLMDFI